MGSSLVIVESPAKARTLNKILGEDFIVKASVGHVKDLPEKELGVEKDKDFEPTYVVIPGKEKIIRELKAASKKAEKVYLAPDPDREGEAIAFHIAAELAGKGKKAAEEADGKLFRITFHEITERAVKEALKNPGRINVHKVDAQQARRVLDRLVGYELSPLLWRKVRRGLSAGRVQSVAVRLVVEREKEIEAFKKEEYWSVEAMLEGSQKPAFEARLFELDGKPVIERGGASGQDKFLLRNGEDARRAVEALSGARFILSSIEKKARRRSPSAPFITSSLQQEAAQRLGFTAKKTMMLAQGLYEGVELGGEGPVGLITYMRTDSVNIAAEAQQWAREVIKTRFGEKYLPEKPPKYKSKASAQEAHEAIRPTYPDRTPEKLKPFLQKDQLRLYTLIWNRFMASQMAQAELEQTVFTIKAGDAAVLKASGTVIKFDGFLAIYKDAEDENEGAILPALPEGEGLKLLEIKPLQHFTQPPPRYSEATLVKTLEEKGIGRPSTYATILSTIQDRKYVAKEASRFKPTDLGVLVTGLLVEKFPELMDTGFTARMEDELDEIEQGNMKWQSVIKEFYVPFGQEIETAIKTPGKVRPEDVPTDVKCQKCGLPMVKRWGRHGWFLACSGYPECKSTCPIDEPECQAPAIQETCEKCGSPMVLKTGRFGKFLACSGYPACKSTKPISLGIKCPADGGQIVERRSKKGKLFYSCSNYPSCKFISWYKPVNKACPNCKNPYLLEKNTKAAHVLFCPNKECGFSEEIKEEAAGGSQQDTGAAGV
ncbi:MAG: type I DNA topoisomerase [Actinomycetota bacterium]|nr:type I DNA topoisomerase [Actinomycetota bacterium]